MAEMRYTYKDIAHKISNYDEIISTYTWIHDALCSVFENREGLSVSCHITFSADEMTYECSSIEEFKKYAFGKNIQIDRLYVSVSENWKSSLIHVFASYKENSDQQDYVLTSNDELTIINLRETLQMSKKVEPKPKETIVMKIEDNSVYIGDNNNISNSVVGSKNATEIEQKNEISENKKESFLSKTFWQFIVPIAAGIIVVILAVWLGLQ